MRNHTGTAGRRKPSKRTAGVRELKTHAARIVRHVRDSGASYILTHRGHAVGVILPLDSSDGASQLPEASDASVAWETFMRAGRRIERRFRKNASGVHILSAMRR